MLQPGSILKSQYEITSFLARGFSNAAYCARDLFLGRELLVKELCSPSLQDKDVETFRERFGREAEILSSLSHPSIPRLFDFFREGESLFQVMEMIPGRSLEDVLRTEGRLTPSRALEEGKRLLEVLLYLHRHDPPVIHRDIQPGHLITGPGSLSLVSLGHAVRPGDDPGDFRGSPGYAAPEAVMGEAPGTAGDIYSAGVVIYQALTGINPMALGPGGEMPPLQEVLPSLPSEAIAAVHHALEADPSRRCDSAARFLSALSLARSVLEDSRTCPSCGGRDAASSLFCSFCGRPAPGNAPAAREKDPKGEVQFSGGEILEIRPGGIRDSCLYPAALLSARYLGFDNLLTIDHNRIEEYPHQVRAVRRALKEMGGCCILADEVGLGKTVEAGIIMEELMVRGLVRTVLAVVPSHLRMQWREEMREKFDEEFRVHTTPGSVDLAREEKVIVSLDAAGRQGATRDALLKRSWDMVIVDEAHHARNIKTLRWKFLDSLKKSFILLLSATPVQNRLSDLFSLATILRPGHFKTMADFRKEFVDSKNPRVPKNADRMREMLGRVMIRTRRADAMIRFPRRVAMTRLVALNPREEELYRTATGFILELARKDPGRIPFGLMQMQQRLVSSPQAASVTLKKMSENGKLFSEEELSRWHGLYLLSCDVGQPAKADELMGIIEGVKDKVAVFTDHIPTQDFLMEFLTGMGVRCAFYRGDAKKKDKALEDFRGGAGVLLACQTGGEGLNLQHHCNVLVNYDLPWNPMRLEQRIGRLQRLGQSRDVYIFNLAGKDTIEAYLLEVLEEKIKMFQLCVGQLDLILGTRFSEEGSFESLIWKKLTGGEEDLRSSIASIAREMQEEIKGLEEAGENERLMDVISPAG
jgi:superfamily II DNA or RNA helicase/tRNA A-37 threonylcarbamoyl transferase component Bud32